MSAATPLLPPIRPEAIPGANGTPLPTAEALRDSVKGARVTVVGGARSGLAVAHLLARRGADVFLTDHSPAEAGVAEGLKKNGVASEFGGHTPRALDADWLVLSPGVPTTTNLVQSALRQKKPVYAELGTSGALAVLPPGWDGPSTVNELRAPSYSSYELTNTRPGHPLLGTTLHLERVTGLQEPFRRLWLNGQTTQGYHGLDGVAAAEVPLPGVAIELAGRGRGGVLALVQTRTAYWAVHVSAPKAVWAARRAELVALLQALQLP